MVIGSLHKSQIAWYDSVIDMDRTRVKIISIKIKEPHNSVASPVLGIHLGSSSQTDTPNKQTNQTSISIHQHTQVILMGLFWIHKFIAEEFSKHSLILLN